MSRIGKLPIELPEAVEVKIDGSKVSVKGKLGELQKIFDHRAIIKVEGNQCVVSVKNEKDKFERSLWGTARSIISNMVEGVVKGFEKKLEISGVGYSFALKGKQLELKIGYSHPVFVDIPEDLDLKIDKNILTVSGIDKELVGKFAAQVRALKKTEPYKLKGIKYTDEVPRKKAGKAAKGAESAVAGAGK